MTLAQALETVELEPGRIYRCRVRGMDVILRVAETGEKTLLSKSLCEEDIMLDPWCELHSTTPSVKIPTKPGERILSDIPYIPSDDEGES